MKAHSDSISPGLSLKKVNSAVPRKPRLHRGGTRAPDQMCDVTVKWKCSRSNMQKYANGLDVSLQRRGFVSARRPQGGIFSSCVAMNIEFSARDEGVPTLNATVTVSRGGTAQIDVYDQTFFFFSLMEPKCDVRPNAVVT